MDEVCPAWCEPTNTTGLQHGCMKRPGHGGPHLCVCGLTW